MQINMGEPYWLFDRSQVQRLEKEAIYVGDLAIKSRRGMWSEVPAAVFYTPKPRVGYTNHYFGVYKSPSLSADGIPTWAICDASSVAEHIWSGIELKGEVIFSRWRHDFRNFSFGGPCVDGGPDYMRVVGVLMGINRVSLKLDSGIFRVI